MSLVQGIIISLLCTVYMSYRLNYCIRENTVSASCYLIA